MRTGDDISRHGDRLEWVLVGAMALGFVIQVVLALLSVAALI